MLKVKRVSGSDRPRCGGAGFESCPYPLVSARWRELCLRFLSSQPGPHLEAPLTWPLSLPLLGGRPCDEPLVLQPLARAGVRLQRCPGLTLPCGEERWSSSSWTSSSSASWSSGSFALEGKKLQNPGAGPAPESRPRTFQNATRSETSELLISNSFLFLAGARGTQGLFASTKPRTAPAVRAKA